MPHRPGCGSRTSTPSHGVLVLSERSRGRDPGAGGAAPAAGADPFGDDPLSAGWIVPSIDSPSATWLGANPEPDSRLSAHRPHVHGHTASVLQIDLDEREETLLKQEPVLGDFDAGRYITFRTWAARRRRDAGARSRWCTVADLALPAPCLLYGYGAYEISIDPAFSHHRLSPARPGRGLRRGPRPGRRRDGPGLVRGRPDGAQGQHLLRLHRRAPATWSNAGVARPGALAGRGGSAGGLLIGAVANQAPELFRALVAEVPFVDCVTTMLDDELPLTVGEWEEWGNPRADERGLPAHALVLALRQRRPATNADGTARTYPDLLVTAGLNDPRVGYWEPAKWVAKLRALRPTTRVLLRTEMGAGHGGPSGRYDAWKEEASCTPSCSTPRARSSERRAPGS